LTLPSGSHLGPYEILALLGAGGRGEVYRARDPRLERDVAVKLLPEGTLVEPARLARFPPIDADFRAFQEVLCSYQANSVTEGEETNASQD